MFKTVAQLMAEATRKDSDEGAEARRLKSFAHAEAALKGYLRYHGKQAEPWMYVWLIKAIEARKAPEIEVKRAIGFAALLAKRSLNPNDLVRIADMMVVRNLYGPVGDPGFETNVGELLDLAIPKAPASAYPSMMSINLATRTKDPKRMGDAAEQLLSLGWAGTDDAMRKDVATQVNGLIKALTDDGRKDEADALAARLAASEVRDVYVQLKWVGEADIDLVVDEPLGATASYRTPRTVFGGSIVKNGYGKHPDEVYVCPRGFDGDYTIRVEPIFIDETKPVTEATLTVITREGSPEESRREIKVDLAKPEPLVVKLTGGRRKEVLPFVAPTASPAKEKEQSKPNPKPDPKAPAAKAPAPRPAPPR